VTAWRAIVLAIVCLLASGAQLRRAHAEAVDEQVGVMARVVIDRAALRTGPGAGFRIVQVAQRGESFPLLERATRGYWFRVQLGDGSLAWIDGNAVYADELRPAERGRRFMAFLFAPPPLSSANGELSVQLGALSGAGFLAVRPSLLLAPSFGFEANLAASVGSLGRSYMSGAGPLVNVFPHWPIVPFFTIGGGFAFNSPNADTFVLEAGSSSMAYAGGGLRFGFRHRLIVRVEGRSYAFFAADRLVAQQEVSGGLSAFF
jgi:hypothetical protein